MRGPRFRSLASQITVLAAVPSAAVILAVAGLTLFLNQHTRLETFLQTDASLAGSIAAPAAAAVRQATDAFPGRGSDQTEQRIGDLFMDAVAIRPGEPDRLGARFGRDQAEVARALAVRALSGDGFAISDVVEAPAAAAPVVLAAHARADGTVDVGSIRVGPDIAGVAWQTVVRRALPSPAGVQVALLDGQGVFAYHDDRRRIGTRSEQTGNASAHAGVSADPDGDQRIAALAPLPFGSWWIVTERPWNPWLEAFRGIGLVVLPPLLLVALLPVLLIALAAARATRPLRQLRAAARRLAAGDFRPLTVTTHSGDEVEDLTRQFESMAAQLESLYGALEQRVAARTAELQIVVDLARAVTGSFDTSAVIRATETSLIRHPDVLRAHVWISAAAGEALGTRSTAPSWAAGAAVGLAPRRPAQEAGVALRQIEGGDGEAATVALPLEIREGAAALVIQAGARTVDQDLERLVLAAGAQVAIALDNIQLYRHGRASAALEERNRLAREIHDTLAQTLTGVIVHLEASQRASSDHTDAMGHLASAQALAREGLREARRSVQGLRAGAVDTRALDEALAGAVARADAAGHMDARLAVHGDAQRIPASVSTELYRIGEEALTNAARHSNASHLVVNLHVSETVARLVVEDDGRGIDARSRDGRGFGLVGMRERAERLRGHLRLESERGKGTRVEATIPLDQAPSGSAERDA